MSALLTIAIVLFVLALVLMFGIPYFIRKNTEEPETKRKWTDPKYHE